MRYSKALPCGHHGSTVPDVISAQSLSSPDHFSLRIAALYSVLVGISNLPVGVPVGCHVSATPSLPVASKAQPEVRFYTATRPELHGFYHAAFSPTRSRVAAFAPKCPAQPRCCSDPLPGPLHPGSAACECCVHKRRVPCFRDHSLALAALTGSWRIRKCILCATERL